MSGSRRSRGKSHSALALGTITEIERRWCDTTAQTTHWHGCHADHAGCAVRLLVAEIDRLRDVVQSLLGLQQHEADDIDEVSGVRAPAARPRRKKN